MLSAYKFLIWLFWGVLAFFLAISTNSFYFFRSFDVNRNISTLMPQGWGFFTKDPRIDDNTLIYRVNGAEIEEITFNNLSSNGVGISKNNRYVLYEGTQITALIPKSVWEHKKGGELRTDSVYIVPKYNKKLYYFEKNKIYLAVKRKPLPFIWANADQEKNIPFKIVKFIIE